MGLLVEVLRWAAGLWLLWRVAGVGSSPAAKTAVVIVPARDEAANLRVLLPTLAGWSVVVVDDESSDGTAEVARSLGAVVVEAGPRPEGWTGKAWACWRGARSVAGRGDVDTLVFLDADTRLEPGGLERIVGEHRAGELLSVQPYHVTEQPYERLSAFFNVIGMMGTDAFTPLGDRLRPRGAFGPCLVVDRSTYDSIGGHEAVKSAVMDDVALARLAPAVRCRGGRDAISFRMYPEGLGQLVEGWTKNFASGAGATRPLTLLLVVAWLSGCISAPFVSPWVYAAYVVQLAWMFRRIGRFGLLTAALYPVPLAFFLAVFVRSIVATRIRRTVRWKGRDLRV